MNSASVTCMIISKGLTKFQKGRKGDEIEISFNNVHKLPKFGERYIFSHSRMS